MASNTATAQLDWVSLTGNFLLVLVLLLAVLWVLRRLQGIKGLQGLRPVARRLAVVEALSVGPRQKLAIVRLDNREVLVGVSPNGFALLDTVPPATSTGAASGGAVNPTSAPSRGVLA
jgi:flagellar protein FliO/FliZ